MHSILFIFILNFFYYPVDGKTRAYFESGYYNMDDRTMLHPDPELKIQIIQWIKDNIDTNLVKTWYNMSLPNRNCVRDGFYSIIDKLIRYEEDLLNFNWNKFRIELKAHIDDFCYIEWEVMEKFYEGLRNYITIYQEWYETLPNAMKKSYEKLVKTIYSVQYIKCPTKPLLLNEKKICISIGKLLFSIKNQLKIYFKKQNYYSSDFRNRMTSDFEMESLQIPASLEDKFTKDLDSLYDHLHVKYSSIFGKYEMAAIVEEYEESHMSSSNKIECTVYLIFWPFILYLRHYFSC